ncbi:MAG: hypothetical protein ACI94Y_002527 [Maribacter sp.]|jgi:hypothetical protein
MHGDGSGNLMIYYNDKIMVIDFKVFESKSYKFFIDEKLCEIFIIKHKKNKGYRYEFKFDNKTKTAYNERRKAAIKKSNTKGIAVMIGVPLMIALVIWSYSFFRKTYLEYQFNHNSTNKWATIRIYTEGRPNYFKTFYFFDNVGKDAVRSSTSFSSVPPTLPNGLPMEDGDIFAVKFVKKHDFYHKVNYDQPDVNTALKMMKRVAPFHIQHNQGKMKQELLCEVQAAFDIKGMNGLANIIQQNTNASENSNYNQDSYLKMKRDSPFQQAAKKCWKEQVN